MMSNHIVYVDRFQISEGKTEEFRKYAEGLAGLAEEQERGAISFNYFVDEDGTRGTAVFVFADAAALDRYLDLASPKFREAVDLVSSTDIELLGDPSDRAAQLAKAFNGTVKRKLAGFSR
jgi:quinol monooxygenase YgiN